MGKERTRRGCQGEEEEGEALGRRRKQEGWSRWRLAEDMKRRSSKHRRRVWVSEEPRGNERETERDEPKRKTTPSSPTSFALPPPLQPHPTKPPSSSTSPPRSASASPRQPPPPRQQQAREEACPSRPTEQSRRSMSKLEGSSLLQRR